MYNFRNATVNDLPACIELLHDDPLGAKRESIQSEQQQQYIDAFAAICNDKNNNLLLAIENEKIIAMLQMTYIPGLTYQGAWRSQVEGVRVHRDYRRQGVGKLLLEYVINLARERNCIMMQLTTNYSRADALAFYQSLGFVDTHHGLKLMLNNNS